MGVRRDKDTSYREGEGSLLLVCLRALLQTLSLEKWRGNESGGTALCLVLSCSVEGEMMPSRKLAPPLYPQCARTELDCRLQTSPPHLLSLPWS